MQIAAIFKLGQWTLVMFSGVGVLDNYTWEAVLPQVMTGIRQLTVFQLKMQTASLLFVDSTF